MADMPIPGQAAQAPIPGGAIAPAPAPAGAAVRAPNAGLRSRSLIDVGLAYKTLNRALPGLDPGSSEAKAVLKAMSSLGAILGGGPSDALTQTEVRTLGAQAPSTPAVTPDQQQAFANAIRQRMQLQPPAAPAPPMG